MKTTNPLTIAIVLLSTSLFVIGCNPVRIHEADQSYMTLYEAKQKAKKEDDIHALLLARSGFTNLARESAAAAAELRTKRREAIGLGRVSAGSVWQAEPWRDQPHAQTINSSPDGTAESAANVKAYADIGLARCGEDLNIAPRDCGMLALIPHLAAIDEKTFLYDQIKDNDSQDWDGMRKVFDSYEYNLTKLIGPTAPPSRVSRKSLFSLKASPEFRKAIDLNIETTFCNLQDQIAAYIDQHEPNALNCSTGDQPTDVKQLKCHVEKFVCKAQSWLKDAEPKFTLGETCDYYSEQTPNADGSQPPGSCPPTASN
uniref:Uncharacterized protein n=1 Tax=Candidatus Kentrum sp. FM TaxID=2126340 RepID=A0A450S2U9_9GAMM|nr:MAG: hypothetical protein BECKFM1743A_GA0114220_1002911 [Candidatus Kentron sp. FM]VFJ45968.1 MAG: hypothetical protein BECKFM1743C_GA0114222_1003211 [Candidatus Kentron sp. FM]VFK07413.1 MAG: hypothetical protein BECKFM1743B_GA0114221_1004011 [Candidatus Kentron sp. FM]